MAVFEAVEILLVEDNPTDAELTLLALNSQDPGRRVHWAQDGAEALDFMFCTGAYASRPPNQRPRLVLLDLKMPKVSGIDVLRAIKADERTRSVPVVILSSSAEERDIAECYRLNANSFMVKPLNFEHFVDAVSRASHYWTKINRVPV